MDAKVIAAPVRAPFYDFRGGVRSAWNTTRHDPEFPRAVIRATASWIRGVKPGSSEKRELLLFEAGRLFEMARLNRHDAEWYIHGVQKKINET